MTSEDRMFLLAAIASNAPLRESRDVAVELIKGEIARLAGSAKPPASNGSIDLTCDVRGRRDWKMVRDWMKSNGVPCSNPRDALACMESLIAGYSADECQRIYKMRANSKIVSVLPEMERLIREGKHLRKQIPRVSSGHGLGNEIHC